METTTTNPMIRTIMDDEFMYNCMKTSMLAKNLIDPYISISLLHDKHPANLKGTPERIFVAFCNRKEVIKIWDDVWAQYAHGVKQTLQECFVSKTISYPIQPCQFVNVVYRPALDDSLKRHGKEAQLFVYNKAKEVVLQCLSEFHVKDCFRFTFEEPTGEVNSNQYFFCNYTGTFHVAKHV